MDLQRSDQADISQFYNGYTRTASDLQGIIQYYCTTVFYNTASHITKGEGCTKHPHEIHNTFTTSVVFCNTKLETTGAPTNRKAALNLRSQSKYRQLMALRITH